MPTPPEGLAPIVDTLLATLSEERAVLDALRAQFAQQLDALRCGTRAPLEGAMHKANDLLGRLDELRRTRERQTRLLARMLALDPGDAPAVQPVAEALQARGADGAAQRLRAVRCEVRQGAADVQRQGQALGFALQYAIGLGREMLSLLYQTDATAPQATYTAAGQTTAAAAPAHSLVNRLG